MKIISISYYSKGEKQANYQDFLVSVLDRSIAEHKDVNTEIWLNYFL